MTVSATTTTEPFDLEAIHDLQVRVGKENYMISGDGYLMPVRKDQPPPDLRYFPRR